MAILKAIWKWLDNKKSAIGLTAVLVWAWLNSSGYIPADIYKLGLDIATVWGVVAVGHKVAKGVTK